MTAVIADRRGVLAAAAALLAGPAFAQAVPPSAGAASPVLVEDLVLANRILFDQGVVDAFGHVSVRHDKNPGRFLLARNLAPGQVTAADILEYDLDGTAIDAKGRALYLERFIHGAIYRARPDVGAVVHSHSPGVIPFGVSKARLRPVYHMAGFLGGGVPVFEVRDGSGEATDMLIRNPRMAADLARALGQHSVALMRGHGSVAVGPDVRLAVMRAVYTETDARLQAEAMKLGKVTYLSEAEAEAARKATEGQVDRPWNLWREQVLAKRAAP